MRRSNWEEMCVTEGDDVPPPLSRTARRKHSQTQVSRRAARSDDDEEMAEISCQQPPRRLCPYIYAPQHSNTRRDPPSHCGKGWLCPAPQPGTLPGATGVPVSPLDTQVRPQASADGDRQHVWLEKKRSTFKL